MNYLDNLFQNLSSQFGNILPRVIGAIIILIIGYFIAKICKRIVKKVLKRTSIDERIGQKMNTTIRVDDFVASLTYYLILLYAFIVVLSLLGVQGVLLPIEGMLNRFLSYVPNILAGGIIGFIGYMIAKFVSEASGFLTERIEKLSTNNGFDTSSVDLAKIVKQLVFIVVFIPILIVALDTLKLDAVSKPATEMLESMLLAIPKIITATILLAIFYILGKYVIQLVVNVMQGLGLDKLAKEMGLSNIIGGASLSKTLGNIAFFFIMFIGLIAAANKLEMNQINMVLRDVFEITGRIFFGLVILVLGVYISNIAVNAINKSSENAWLSQIIRFATIGLFLAFALHTMGIAENIVELAFGLTLGAIAVAFALSFGLGGREVAGEQMAKFFARFKK